MRRTTGPSSNADIELRCSDEGSPLPCATRRAAIGRSVSVAFLVALKQARHQAPGSAIQTLPELRAWLGTNRTSRGREVTATFVVNAAGTLHLADRHSEHVACAGGRPVRSAGEMTFTIVGERVELTSASNQSTGYCPEPESWAEVQRALDGVGVVHPGAFTTIFDFRRCPACGQINLIKDGIFCCDVCDAELPRAWNFGG